MMSFSFLVFLLVLVAIDMLALFLCCLVFRLDARSVCIVIIFFLLFVLLFVCATVTRFDRNRDGNLVLCCMVFRIDDLLLLRSVYIVIFFLLFLLLFVCATVTRLDRKRDGNIVLYLGFA